MEAISADDIRSVTLLIKEKHLSSVRAILNFLKERFPAFKIQKFTTGELGEDVLVSFKVSKEFYPKVLEKFAYNDIPIILNDEQSIELVHQRKELKNRKLRAQGWTDISRKKRQISLATLMKFADNGKVREVSKEARGGVGSNLEIVKKAKELLSETVVNAIDNLVFYAEEKFSKAGDAIEQLLLIATDKELRILHKNEEMDKAGFTALLIAQTHKNYYPYIIKIANNTKLNNLTNIKAAICLAELVFEETENKFEDIDFLIKKLNTRWLRIAYETVLNKITTNEKTSFAKIVEFVEEKRRAA